MNTHTDSAVDGTRASVLPGTTISALAVPLLLSVYLILTSTRYLLPDLNVLDAKRILEITMFGVIIIITLFDPKLRKSFFEQLGQLPRWFSLGMIGFFGLGVISSVYNASSWPALAYSLADVYMLAMMIMLALVVAACRSLAGTRFDRLAMFLLALLGLSVGLQELVGVYVAWSAGYQFSYDIALTHFAHPRFFNQLQSWTVPLLAALPLVFPRNRLTGFGCVAVLGLHWYIMLMTGARGSTLSLLTAFFVALLVIPDSRRLIIKWQSAGIVVGVLVYGLMFLGPESGFVSLITPTLPPQSSEALSGNEITHGKADHGEADQATAPTANPYYELSLGRPMLHTSGRFSLWRSAIQHARDRPLLGIGPMNFACKGPPGRVGHPHNFAMQILSEWGLPATLLIFGLLSGVLAVLFKRLKMPRRNNPTTMRQLRAVLSVSVLAAVFHSGLSGLFIMPASQVIAVLVCGWLLGTCSQSKSEHSTRPSGRHINHPGVSILILLLMATLLFGSLAIHELKYMNIYEKQLPSIESAIPRFWQTGKVCSLE